MKKRLMSLALSAALLLGVAPLSSVISTAETMKYDIWVNGQRLTSESKTVKCGSGTATYNPDDNTLVLLNAQITLGSSESGSSSGILSQESDLNINLTGSNIIENTGGCAILASSASSQDMPCSLSFTGSGVLTIADTSSKGGIQASGNIDINGTILDVSSTGPAIVSNGDVIIKGGKVTAKAGGSSNVISSKSGRVSITSSTVSATGSSGAGIYLGSGQSGSSVTIKDSTITDTAAQGIQCASADSCSVTFENSVATIKSSTAVSMIPDSNLTLRNCYISSGSFSGTACEISNKALSITVTYGQAYITGKYGTDITSAMPGNSITIVPNTQSQKYNSKWSASGVKFERNDVIAEFVMPAKAVSLSPTFENQSAGSIVFDDDRTVVGEDMFLSLVCMYGVPSTDTSSLVQLDLDGDGTDDLYGYRSDYSFEIQPSCSITSNTFTANKLTIGKYRPITIQLVGHIHSMEYHKYKEATCSELGNKAYYQCSECCKKFLDEDGTMPVEDEKELVIDMKSHTPGTPVDEKVVKATCEKDGSKDVVIYCTGCKKELSRSSQTIPATGHNWTDWVTVTAATNTTEGKEKHSCTYCKKEETRTIPKLTHVHSVKYISPVASTCTEQGCQGYYECTSCRKIFSDKDCTKEISSISSLKLPMSDHEWDGKRESVNRKEPTCTTPGSEQIVKHCKHCGAEIGREYVNIEAPGHSWGDWETVTPVQEKTNGLEKHTCTTCGFVEQRVIPATGHVHNMIHFEQKDPTCTEDGTKEYYQCRDCKRMYLDKDGKIPVNSSFDLLIYLLYHDFDVNSPVIENKVEATATTEGHYDEVVYCKRCGQEMKRTTIKIPAIGSSGNGDDKDDTYTVFIGDADLSGTIDIEDVVVIMQQINGIKPLPTQNAIIADVNFDKVVDIDDVVMIVGHINGIKPLADIKTSSKAS